MPLDSPSHLELDTLRRLVQVAGQRILEIGVGDARLTLHLAPGAAAWLGLDPDPDELSLAAEALRSQPQPNVRLVLGDGRGLALPSGHFDLVLFTWSLC